MKQNLIRTCNGEIINLDTTFNIRFDEKRNATIAWRDCGGDYGTWAKIADGDVTTLLWNGRRDFMEVNYGA